MQHRLRARAITAMAAIVFMCAAAPASATQYFFCYVEPAYGSDNELLALSAIMEVEVERLDEDWLALEWLEHLDDSPTEGTRTFRDSQRGSCSATSNRTWLEEQYHEHYRSRYRWGEPVTWTPVIEKVVPRPPREGLTLSWGVDVSGPPARVEQEQQEPRPDAGAGEEARLAADRRARQEAEEQARLAAERESAEKVRSLYAEQQEAAERFRAEERRKQRQYEEALAQRELQIAEQKREQAVKASLFEAVLEEQRQRQREYLAALERHKRCEGGSLKACADIRAGKLALDGQSADAGEASIETDARRCISAPVVSPNETFKGSTKAVVVNGCESAVDVRICLLRTGGWNCGMTTGLAPQASWSWWSFETQGEVFWDARTAGSNRTLASPN